MPLIRSSLLLHGLLGSLGLLTLEDLRGGGLDDAHSHGLPHVTDSEPGQSCIMTDIQRREEISPSEGRVVSEGLDTHGLAGGQLDNSRVTRLDELGVVLDGLTGTTVNLLLDLGELKIPELPNIPCKDEVIRMKL